LAAALSLEAAIASERSCCVPPRNEFARPVVVEPWPEGGIAVQLSADPAELRALARRFDLLELTALSATGRLERRAPGNEIWLVGRLEAEAVQACVVSLEPVPARVRQPIERGFRKVARPLEPGAAATPPTLWLVEDDEIEPLTGRTIDLGEVVAEELALALDPYPRRADAEALVSERLGPNISFGAPEPSEPPLAALAQLKDRRAT
jgi:uncharacterized metal-binding protein YceD (DUF177 family)